MFTKSLLISPLLAYCSLATSMANIQIEIDAGILRNRDGSQVVPTGGLLQLVASTSGRTDTFAPPTPGSFVNGDNIVLASFGMNNINNVGEADFVVGFDLQPAIGFNTGDALLLRWFPDILTTNDAPSRTPTTGDQYGQYRFGNMPSDPGENGGISWFAPSDGSSFFAPNGLNFLTLASGGGSRPESDGFANFTVAPVPEPSTYALLGLGLGGLTLGVLRRHRRQALGAHAG